MVEGFGFARPVTLARGGRGRAQAVLVSLALVVGACGTTTPPPSEQASVAPSSAAPSSAAPSATPAATPAPTPQPVAALTSTLSGAAWAGQATVAGTLTVGTKPYAIAGIFEVQGQDTHETRTVKLGGVGAGEWLTSGGNRYTRSAAGVWFADAAVGIRDDLRKFLTLASGFTDMGPSTTSAGPANHFQLAQAALGPRALGLVGIAVTDPVATLDIDAAADGSPIEMRIAAKWSATVAGTKTPVGVDMKYAFDSDASPTVTAPAEVWTMQTSKLFKYRLGIPNSWQAYPSTTVKFVDDYEGPELTAFAYRDRSHGFSLSTLASYQRTHAPLKNWKSWKVTSTKSAKLDGAVARVMTGTAVEGGTKMSIVVYLTLRSGWFYWVGVTGSPGDAKGVAAFATQLASTFRFPR
jgi:hypothetical protein